MNIPPDEIRDERGNFEGLTGRECGEHRTVGDYRAWCYECSEWCYPSAPCVRCELPALTAERDALVAQLAAALAPHASDDGRWCNDRSFSWPCATARALGVSS